jgi:aspartate aminotransferase
VALGSGNKRGLKPSATVELMNKASALKAQGLDILSFSGGEPDSATPAHISDVAIASLRAGDTHYVSSRGIPKLLNAIAGKLERENAVKVDPAKGVIVTTGSKIAIYITMLGLLAPGDEMLYFEPAWVSYEPMIRLASAVPVAVPTDARHGFRLDEKEIEARITPRTRGILINSPNNPTGHVLSAEELTILDRVANKHDLFVISDEIYEHVIYDLKHVSPASLPGLANRTLTLNGFSKAYAMTGWRLGYVAGPNELVSQVLPVQQHVVTCATSFVQEAAAVALTGPQEPMLAMTREYRKRRDVIVAGFNSMPGVTCESPEGAFYAFPRFQQHPSSRELAAGLLEKALVAATPGVEFGAPGEGHLRFSFACPMHDIEVGVERMRKYLAQ